MADTHYHQEALVNRQTPLQMLGRIFFLCFQPLTNSSAIISDTHTHTVIEILLHCCRFLSLIRVISKRCYATVSVVSIRTIKTSSHLDAYYTITSEAWNCFILWEGK